jgi:hypothetical protein
LDQKNLTQLEYSLEVINNRCNLIEPLFKSCVDISAHVSEDLAIALRNIFSSVTRNNEDWYEFASAASFASDQGAKAGVYNPGGRRNSGHSDDSASKRKRVRI